MELITKQEIEELKKIEGEVKGNALIENFNFISQEEGPDGLIKLEQEMEKMGYPIDSRQLKTMDFYPLWLDAILLITIERLFKYDSQKLERMGSFEPKTSLVIRLFMKYFVSLERAAKEASGLWKSTFTVGNLKIVSFDKEKKEGILRLENYKFIPLQCQIFKGYFASIIKMIVGGNINCQETKCVHRGDSYHEFSCKW